MALKFNIGFSFTQHHPVYFIKNLDHVNRFLYDQGVKKENHFQKMQYSCNSNINALFACCEKKVRREKYNIFAVLYSIRNVRKMRKKKSKKRKERKCFSLDNILVKKKMGRDLCIQCWKISKFDCTYRRKACPTEKIRIKKKQITKNQKWKK